MFGRIGIFEILVIIVIGIVLFIGIPKLSHLLPQLAKSIGEAIKNFKEAIKPDKKRKR
jgi:TatA/E family protein of Tat protein translocase